MASNTRPSVEEYIKTHPIAEEYAENLLHIEYTGEELTAMTKELAARVSKDYKHIAHEGVVLIGVLKGVAFFYGELLRYLTIPLQTEFIAISSYEGSESGKINLKKDVPQSTVEDKHVIIVEDLIDTGNTLYYLIEHFKTKNPKSVKLLTLLDKPSRRVADIQVDYAGLHCSDNFVVGYGMDFNEKYRNMPFLAALKPEAYQTQE